jgi:tRNA-specific 2-thiouridylase
VKRDIKKVYVGISGGVDSSVSAGLLKKAGYDVTGVFIKTWHPDFVECTWREDRLDAMRVCAKLDIPFVTLDLEKEYKRDVADYMIAEYKTGRTPNPDVMCNKYVKFGAFFDWAMEQGTDFVATGHYAKTKYVLPKDSSLEHGLAPQREATLKSRPRSSASESRHPAHSACEVSKDESFDRTLLLAGNDKNKDQSYFLWTLTQKQLSKTLFPVGDIEKPEVREIAKRLGLSTSDKKDSQGVCFLGEIDIKEFLKNYIKEKSGEVLNESGKIIGEHDGAFFLTIGQRHGFKITEKTPNDSPYYIVDKNIEKNTILVSQDKNKIKEKESKIVHIKNVNWIYEKAPDLSKIYSARIRYRQPLEECRIVKSGEGFELYFTNPQKAITPGQSAVIYDGEVCLGGGIIR